MPRVGTKQATLIGLLGRARGATIREMTDGTGWRANTVHSALVTLRKRGWQVAVEQTAAGRRYLITAGPESTPPASEQVSAGA
jgi:DNA-binding IclR family transcriptional regulator